ncbi:MAG: PAS domain S-box protein [Deltaproteobacteria bacterium]
MTCKDGTEKILRCSPVQLESGQDLLTFEDITDRKWLESELKESQERYGELYGEFRKREELFQSLLNSSADAIAIYDLQGRAKYVNPSFTRMFGWELEEIEGERIPFLPDSEREATNAAMGNVVHEGMPLSSFETKRYTKDGRVLDISMNASRYLDERGCPARMLVILRDITASERERERQSKLVEEIKKFAYIVSHDLRTPLANLGGFCNELKLALEIFQPIIERALLSLDDEEKSRVTRALRIDVPESLEFIDSSLARMESLIGAILELSRTDCRDLHFEPLDMNELIQGTLNILGHQIKHLGVNIVVGRLPETVADRASMEQIVGNLLGNAIKYLDPERPGRIGITGYHFPDENVFVIRDNGCGIERSHLTRIFQAFQRIGKQDTRGEGMGLAHVRTLVRRHGGRIWCESKSGVGSTFTFTVSNDLVGDTENARGTAGDNSRS